MLAREERKNKMVVAFEENGVYVVKASVNGRTVGEFKTTNKYEAMEVYGETVYCMYQ